MENYPAPIRKQVVDGQWVGPFIYVAGRLSIDFTQTGGETPPVRAAWDMLKQPSDLADWLADCPLQISGVEVTPGEFEVALALREAIWRAASAISQSLPPQATDLDLINRAASAPDLYPRISPDGMTGEWQGPMTGAAALSTIARDAIDLFSGELRARIRTCENPVCDLMFVDTSRPGKRRWCHMDRCGNRFKTAAYRRRKKKVIGDQ